MEAIKIVNEKAVVNRDRCIGCGNCVTTCGMESMKLRKKDKTVSPPKTHNALYTKIMIKKKGIIGALGVIGKSILGKKA